jgi:hypothetical protein
MTETVKNRIMIFGPKADGDEAAYAPLPPLGRACATAEHGCRSRPGPGRGSKIGLKRSYCCGTDLLVPCMKACISSRVRRPSLLASIALKIRS